MEDKNKIGDFFRTHLSDHKEDINLMEVEMISARMSKRNFMKFNARNFNVYYAAAIVSGFLITLTLGGHYIQTYKKQNELLQKTQNELTALANSINQSHKWNDTITLQDQRKVSNVPDSSSMQPYKSNLTRSKNLTQPNSSLISASSDKSNPSPIRVAQQSHGELETPNNVQLSNAQEQLLHTETQPSPLPEEKVKEQPKKQIVIYKRDTIIQYDTLKVKKRVK